MLASILMMLTYEIFLEVRGYFLGRFYFQYSPSSPVVKISMVRAHAVCTIKCVQSSGRDFYAGERKINERLLERPGYFQVSFDF